MSANSKVEKNANMKTALEVERKINADLYAALDQTVSICELLIGEGSIRGPMALKGACFSARKLLNEVTTRRD